MDETQEKQKSYIVIQFADFGSAVVAIRFENVTPEQAILGASVLELQARNEYINKENAIREEMARRQLAVPKAEIFKPNGR